MRFCVCVYIFDCVIALQMKDLAPFGSATSLKACQGSTSAEPATQPAQTAAPLTWRSSPVRNSAAHTLNTAFIFTGLIV